MNAEEVRNKINSMTSDEFRDLMKRVYEKSDIEFKEKDASEDTSEDTIADDLISRKWLLEEYDKRHKGPRGGAYQMILDAPSAVDWSKVDELLYDLQGLIEYSVHPVVCPENYWLYSQLHDSLERLENALNGIRNAEGAQ